MKILRFKTFIFLLSINCLFIESLSIEQSKAADFSKAQQTYVPPSYIRRDLDALGTNNWTFPGLSSSPTATTQSSGLNLNSILNGIMGGGGAASTDPTAAAASTAATSAPTSLIKWNNIKGLASQAQNIPGLSSQISKIQTRVSSLMQNGKFGDAENVSRAALKYFPNSSFLKTQFATATVTEAQAFLLAKNYDSAGKKARETLVADPNNKRAKVVIGKVLQAQGLDPNSDAAHVSVADGLVAQGRLLESSVEYKTALDIKPSAAAHVGLGNLAIGKGQITEASSHFEQALSIDPNSALAYRQRGALRYVTRDPVGANSDFSKAVSLNPNDQLASNALIGLWKQEVVNDPKAVNGHLGLARAYMQTNNLEAARAEYKTVVGIDPNHPSLPAARASFKMALAKQEASKSVQAAKTLESQGALTEAHQKLIEATGYSPNDPQIHLYHGQVLEKMGLNEQAHEAYMSVLKADPKNVEAAQRLNYLSSKKSLTTPPYSLSPVPSSAPSIPPSVPVNNINPSPIPAPIPDNNLENIPLKSPINPTTQNQSYNFPGNGYYPVPQNVYYSDSVHVNTLSNFASCIQALLMVEKLQLQSNSKYFSQSGASSNNSSNYVSGLGYPE